MFNPELVLELLKLSSNMNECKPLVCGRSCLPLARSWCTRSSRSSQAPWRQGLTLVHVRAQHEQLQDTFTSQVGFYGEQKSSS